MKAILTSKQEIINDNEATVWYIDKGDGAILINLNKILVEDISECNWLSEKGKYILANYSDWDSTELIAIFKDDGQLIKKGISSIETFIEEKELFVINLSGYGLGGEASYYNLATYDWKMAVIDTYGKFIIEPKYDKIRYEENIFYAKNIVGEEYKYSIKGEIIWDF